MAWNEEDFKRKLITELHDIALSLREISGRNVIDSSTDQRKMTYKEKYFTRTAKKDK